MDRSIRRLGVFLMALFCVLFVQLNYIQVFRAKELNTEPGNSRPVDLAFSKPRGTVSTADGVIVSRSVPISGKKKFQREFPEGEQYAAISGYFNYSFGATGLENAYNEELSGTSADQQVQSIGDLFDEKDTTGNLKLTVRSDVQAAAKAALGDQKGSVVALDPRTGGVLALWSWPTFDPNLLSTQDYDKAAEAKALYEASKDEPLLAKSYRQLYPPGSTFKVVTGATGVETGKVTPSEPSYPVLSSLDVPQSSKNLGNFGGESCGGTLYAILEVSCNSSFGQMGLDLGGPTLAQGAEAFGFNQVPPFDLPAVASQFPEVDWKQNQPVLASSAIGQGRVTATPLQMALVAAGIANDGVILEPHVVDEIRDNDNELIRKIDPTQWKRAVTPQTAEVLREGMRKVVQSGTATRLQIDGLDVGAKTGTAQFGPAEPLKSHAWVIAWAGPPGETPSVVVAVLVEGQDGNSEQTGGRVATPIAKAVIEASMQPLPAPPAATTTTTAPVTTTAPGGGG